MTRGYIQTPENLMGKTLRIITTDYDAAPDVLKYKFATFSDIHLQQADEHDLTGLPEGTTLDGAKDFINALSIAKQQNVDFACVAGDIGINSDKYEQTDSIYDNCLSIAKFDKNVYCCKGNHDAGISLDNWKSITSCELSTYSVTKDDDVFAFLNIKTDETITGYLDAIATSPYLDEDIEQLENIVQSNPGKTIFLFMHFPLNAERPAYQFAGLQELQYPSKANHHVNADGSFAKDGSASRVNQYGFKLKNIDGIPWHNVQNSRILDCLKAHDGKVIVFSGHSHYVFDVDTRSPRVNFSQVSDNVYTVHIPSLNYGRDKQLNPICNDLPTMQPAQGYIVEVYKKKILIRGYEFNQNLIAFDYQKPVRCYEIKL